MLRKKMKELFKPIDYSIEASNTFQDVKPEVLDPETIQKEMNLFHVEVSKLVDEIQRGHSELHRPMQMKATPFFTVLDRMKNAPSKHNIHDFFEVSLQDLGARFTNACKDIFNNGQFPVLNKVIK